MNIIVKNYEHFNRSLGKYITSKKHYEQEMVKGGYMPFEQAEALAEKYRSEARKKYDGLSEKKMRFLNQVKDTADRKGNIKVTDRFVQGLRENGVNIDCNYDKLPKAYREGGFQNEG